MGRHGARRPRGEQGRETTDSILHVPRPHLVELVVRVLARAVLQLLDAAQHRREERALQLLDARDSLCRGLRLSVGQMRQQLLLLLFETLHNLFELVTDRGVVVDLGLEGLKDGWVD